MVYHEDIEKLWKSGKVIPVYNDYKLGILQAGQYVNVYGNEEKTRKKNVVRKKDLWKGRIIEIREGNIDNDKEGEKDVYIRLRWFYTAEHLTRWLKTASFFDKEGKSEIKKSIIEKLGEWELVFSDHEDRIKVSAIEGKAGIMKLEDNINQAFIPDQTHYYRFSVSFNLSKKHEQFAIEGPIPGCGIKECEKYYDPDSDLQRFCRFCETWFHYNCLKEVGEICEDSESILQGAKKKLLGDERDIEQAMLPILRGGTYRDGVAGHIKEIFISFDAARSGKGKVANSKILKAKDVTYFYWDHIYMYKCPKCIEGFL